MPQVFLGVLVYTIVDLHQSGDYTYYITDEDKMKILITRISTIKL